MTPSGVVTSQIIENAQLIGWLWAAFTAALFLIGGFVGLIAKWFSDSLKGEIKAREILATDVHDNYVKKDAFQEYKADRHRRDDTVDGVLKEIKDGVGGVHTRIDDLYNVTEKRRNRDA